MPHVKTPHEIQDYLYNGVRTLAESKILNFLVRYTFGWHCHGVKATYDAMEKATGMSRPTIKQGIEQALESGFFKRGRVKSEYMVNIPNSLEPKLFVFSNSSTSKLFQASNSLDSKLHNYIKEKRNPLTPQQPEMAQPETSAGEVDESLTVKAMNYFTEITGCWQPYRHQTDQWRDSWILPMNRILSLVGDDFEECCVLLDRVKARMDERGLAYVSPYSFVKIAGMLSKKDDRIDEAMKAWTLVLAQLKTGRFTLEGRAKKAAQMIGGANLRRASEYDLKHKYKNQFVENFRGLLS